MSKFRKKPVVIDATQWHKNGDHPLDHHPIGIAQPTSTDLDRYWVYKNDSEGSVVRRFRHPEVSGEGECKHCGRQMHVHGWIDTLEGGNDGAQVVCPGDWIITGVQGENYPCKPEIFAATYEAVTVA
jgi:hypothetical protein